MTHRRTLAILLLSALFALPAHALAQSSGAERRQDKRELRQDRRERRDDRRDLIRLQTLLNDFDRARAVGNRKGLNAVDARLRNILREETREGRRETRKDRRELRRSKREVRQERRERRVHAATGQPGAAARDTRQLRDDRRDARDDRRDLRREQRNQVRRQQIRSALVPLYGVYDGPRLERKRALIAELVAMATAELGENRRELREDRRELREDRRG